MWGVKEIPKSLSFSTALFFLIPCSFCKRARLRAQYYASKVFRFGMPNILNHSCNRVKNSLIHSYYNLQCQVRYILIHFFSIHKTARLTEELFQPWSHGDVFCLIFWRLFVVYFPYLAFILFTIEFWVCCEWADHFYLWTHNWPSTIYWKDYPFWTWTWANSER